MMFFWPESLGSSRIEGMMPTARQVVHALVRWRGLPGPVTRRRRVRDFLIKSPNDPLQRCRVRDFLRCAGAYLSVSAKGAGSSGGAWSVKM